jgi:hypothetical protein
MSTNGYWWLALGLGLVAAAAAVTLLQLFYLQLRRIERGALAVWETGKQVAGNTATTWLLGDITAGLDLLIAEAGRHELLLRGAVGPDHEEART